jgi:hypothetical protein
MLDLKDLKPGLSLIGSPKKLIEVALPLDAINAAAAREKSIRHGHPSALHLWWARRPLAAARAVIFSQLVHDPEDLWHCQKPGQEPSKQVKGHWTKGTGKAVQHHRRARQMGKRPTKRCSNGVAKRGGMSRRSEGETGRGRRQSVGNANCKLQNGPASGKDHYPLPTTHYLGGGRFGGRGVAVQMT